MNSTNEKVEIATENEIVAETEVAATEIAETNTGGNEIVKSESPAQGSPDYEEATETKGKEAEELSIPQFRSETPTEIFAATESSTYQSQPVINQPQAVQPAGHHVRVHPAPVVAVVAPVAPAIHTSCCECDGPWCGYCFCGVCCHPCTGLSLNQKLTGKPGMWGWDILGCIIFGNLFWLATAMALRHEVNCHNFGCYWTGDTKVWSIIAFVTLIILWLILAVRIYNRFAQRRLFLRKQAKNGHFPNNEGCIVSFLCTWFCSPCMFGQMNSAIEKQRLLSSMQPQHTVSYA